MERDNMNTRSYRRIVCAVSAACLPGIASATALTNPGFESGLSGWITFGNVYAEAANPPQFVPNSGNGLVSMFGNFNGGFNVSGMFQQFVAAPGESWTMDVYSRHFSGDAMIGIGAPNTNWAVMKLAFFDAGNNEIGSAERTVLDGTFATDVWHDNLPINGIAPAGTVRVQSLLLYLQPAFGGGAAHFDDASVVPAPSALGLMGAAGLMGLRRRRTTT